MLEVGSVFRFNHMVVEVFSGRPDAGRVFSVQWFTVVEGGMGDISLINTRKGGGHGGDGAEEVVEGENDGEHEERNNY